MLELEGKLADSFHFIGQQIHYVVQFDKTFIGMLFNMLFYKKDVAESRTHQLDQLSSQLHVTFYARLRNTLPQGVPDALERLSLLKAQVDKLKEKWSDPTVRSAWIAHDFYGAWLDQVLFRIEIYNLARQRSLCSDQIRHLESAIKKLFASHFSIFREQKPFLTELWYRFFEPQSLKKLALRLNLIHELAKNTILCPPVLLMLQTTIYLQAIKFYQESFSDLDKSYMDDFNFLQIALTAVQENLMSGAEAIPEDVYREFQSNMSIKFQHQQDTDWKLQFPAFIECGQLAQQQIALLAQKNNFLMSRSRTPSTSSSKVKITKSKSKLKSFMSFFSNSPN